jgi:hypothetical protein
MTEVLPDHQEIGGSLRRMWHRIRRKKDAEDIFEIIAKAHNEAPADPLNDDPEAQLLNHSHDSK